MLANQTIVSQFHQIIISCCGEKFFSVHNLEFFYLEKNFRLHVFVVLITLLNNIVDFLTLSSSFGAAVR